jgi:hypothetical protein
MTPRRIVTTCLIVGTAQYSLKRKKMWQDWQLSRTSSLLIVSLKAASAEAAAEAAAA